jgi:hypothetical protein
MDVAGLKDLLFQGVEQAIDRVRSTASGETAKPPHATP